MPLVWSKGGNSFPPYSVIKGRQGGGFSFPPSFGHLTRKTERKREKGEERKKGRRREKTQGFFS